MKKIKLLLLLVLLVSSVIGVKYYSIKEIQKLQKEAELISAYKNKDILVSGSCSDSKSERIMELIGTKIKEKNILIHGLDHNQSHIECPLNKVIMKTILPTYKVNYIAKERVSRGDVKGQIVHLTGVCSDLKGNKYELTMSKTHVIDYQNGVLNGAVLSLNKIVSCNPEITGNFVLKASLIEENVNNKENQK